ncbi:hypothetical protein J6590_073303 [Homalodisca vitripennis]|nr:hypothetical protein J6590_073303 [Homalodisca vitripennis]
MEGRVATSSSSRATRAAVRFTEARDIFNENRHFHRSRNKFREELQRKLMCKRLWIDRDRTISP